MLRPTSWLPLASLALLVGLTVWLNQLVQTPAARADGTLRHDPDLMVESFSARKLGEDGRVLYTLAARKMVHYPDDDSAFLEAVTMESFDPRTPKITVTADHGRLEEGGDRVWIEGNVVLVRNADAKNESARVTTDRMLLLPDEGIARTSSEVTLESPSTRAHAVGLEFNNQTRILTLQKVHAVIKSKAAR